MNNILTVNLLFSTFVFWIAAKIYILPNLGTQNLKSILIPILLLHSFRHLGLMFLSPGATISVMPSRFAYPAAFGDLLTAIMAIAAILAVIKNYKSRLTLLWIFNIFGTIDLLNAITLATIYSIEPYMGAAYWIPAFWVPALLVTHYITFIILRKHRTVLTDV